ncbi:MAG: hypothetical protein WCA41_03625, partial [Candidatus Acidiferrum sp.]
SQTAGNVDTDEMGYGVRVAGPRKQEEPTFSRTKPEKAGRLGKLTKSKSSHGSKTVAPAKAAVYEPKSAG